MFGLSSINGTGHECSAYHLSMVLVMNVRVIIYKWYWPWIFGLSSINGTGLECSGYHLSMVLALNVRLIIYQWYWPWMFGLSSINSTGHECSAYHLSMVLVMNVRVIIYKWYWSWMFGLSSINGTGLQFSSPMTMSGCVVSTTRSGSVVPSITISGFVVDAGGTHTLYWAYIISVSVLSWYLLLKPLSTAHFW